MNHDKIIVVTQRKVIKELRAELTYWKETAEHFKNESKELEKPKYQTSISEELKNTIEKVNKILDKQNNE